MPRPYCAAAPWSCRSWSTCDLRAAGDLREPRGEQHRRLSSALLVRTCRVDDDPLAGVVTFLIGGAGELELHGTHPHHDLALVLLVAEVFGQLGPGQAGATCGMSSKKCHTLSTG